MNKTDLITQITSQNGRLSKAAVGRAVASLVDEVLGTLSKGEHVTLQGFGSFRVVKRATRKGRNPRTGEEIKIPSVQTVKFVAGKNLKEAVN
jgi:DNA-binding protein HU-beta